MYAIPDPYDPPSPTGKALRSTGRRLPGYIRLRTVEIVASNFAAGLIFDVSYLFRSFLLRSVALNISAAVVDLLCEDEHKTQTTPSDGGRRRQDTASGNQHHQRGFSA